MTDGRPLSRGTRAGPHSGIGRRVRVGGRCEGIDDADDVPGQVANPGSAIRSFSYNALR